ncbi:quinon protein alcohol dehydrogenase-like superfamily [Ostreococcus tauri]|uniref:Quinon protein alcohol dehydrogenase-like superfamily n=1 Tax=Ostreococcus tauri TaxID=70448 RepID=A0A1Y5IJ49_OSTTA|nr:quinon protein alcohol dehydrogenase-like superfamily [Ostreococcus tauri]
MLELHRGRFVTWTPSPVTALATARGGAVVACARESGAIEVYDARDWRCVARVPGDGVGGTSALAWVETFETDGDGGGAARRGRSALVSASLDGRVRSWDLESGRVTSEVDSHAERAGGEAETAQLLAVACDDGCARLLTMVGGDGVGSGLTHKRAFLRVQGRLLSLAWHPSEELLACGSSRGTVHVMDCVNFNEMRRISVCNVAYGAHGILNATDENCVWALTYLPDGTLVSGDSDGAVTFWDAKFGTELSRHQQHKADVLALAATPSGKKVFASGVDSQLAEFEKLDEHLEKEEGYNQWTYTTSKRPHTHDVRALVMAATSSADEDGILISGGNDAQLLAYNAGLFRKQHPVRVVSVPQRTPISITGVGGPNPPLLLAEHAQWLDVWRIGESRKRADKREGTMKLAAAPAHVLRAELAGTRHVLCSAISPNGKMIAVSDVQTLRLFEIQSPKDDNDDMTWSITRQDPPAGVTSARLLAFAPDGKHLAAVSHAGAVNIIDLESWTLCDVLKSHLPKHTAAATALAAAIRHTGEGDDVVTVKDIAVPVVNHVQVSGDNQWLVVVTARGANETDRAVDGLTQTIGGGVHVYNFDTMKLHVSLPPPKTHSSWPPISAVAISSGGVLALAGPSNALFTYDIDQVKPTKWSAALFEAGVDAPTALREMPGQICGLSFDPKSKKSVLLAHTPTAIARVDLSAKITDDATSTNKKKRRRERERGAPENYATADAPGGIRVVKLDNPCLYLGYAGVNKALLIERPWADVLKSMAHPLYRHRFGT